MNLLGHNKIKEQLLKIITLDNFPAALLFSGNKGVGKKTASKEICKILNEFNPKIEKGNFSDLYYFGPKFDDSKVFSINSIRQIIELSYLRPVEGKVKVFILDEIEKLSPGAGEALLKILEEPPPKNLYILITTQPEKIIPTIQSRVVHFAFKNLTYEEIKEYLIQQQYEQADLIARLSNGSLGNALLLIKHNLLSIRNQLYQKFLNLADQEAIQLLRLNKYNFPDSFEDSEQIEYIIFFFKTFYCDALAKIMNQETFFNIDLNFPKMPLKKIQQSITLLHQLETKISENINLKLHFTTCLFELIQLWQRENETSSG